MSRTKITNKKKNTTPKIKQQRLAKYSQEFTESDYQFTIDEAYTRFRFYQTEKRSAKATIDFYERFYKKFSAFIDVKNTPITALTTMQGLQGLFMKSLGDVNVQTIKAGTATTAKTNGADWHLKYNNLLPDYYISESELKGLGWERGNKPSKFAPDKMLYKDYSNKNNHLPQTENRIWYEADINYTQGKRNSQRVLWSNDGLIFVTFDHYETFYEIV